MKKNPKEAIRNVRKIELRTRKLVDGLLQGAHHSVFKGRGIEFSEVREYVPGDDIRAIDWNVTARMNRAFVKEFIEERDLTIIIGFDISASSEFGSQREKRDAAVDMAASLMFAALKNNDRVGLCLFSDKVELFIPPRKGRKHVFRMVHEMLNYPASSSGTDIGLAAGFISKVMKSRSLVFMLSDFFSENFERPLSILRRRHDVVAINLLDPHEIDIPDVGYIQLEDSESGEQMLVNTSDPDFRENLKSLVSSRNSGLVQSMRRMKIGMVQLHSEESFEAPLRRFFQTGRGGIVR